jgi:ABC-2 type transport system ATP-binding protein
MSNPSPATETAPQAFSLHGLTKSYDGDFTLGPLDVELAPGTVLAYVGPNGAGKTTTINCLAGLLRPEAGQALIYGRRVDPGDPSWKEDVGYVGEEQGFYEKLSAAENLRIVARFYSRWSDERARRLAERLELPLDKKVRELSAGNRAKLALVAALAHRPRLVLLDEPTAGLDPVVRAEVLDLLWELLEGGETAVFYSTHVLSDVSRLADELAFLRDGRLLQRHSKEALTDAWRKITFRLDVPEGVRFEGTYEHRQSGAEHQLLSCDHATTLAQLRGMGARDIQESRLPVDEIAVAILRERAHVAAD